jgi:hypothetical protein
MSEHSRATSYRGAKSSMWITSELSVTRPESSRNARIQDQTSEIKREFTGGLCARFSRGPSISAKVLPGAAGGEAFGMQDF